MRRSRIGSGLHEVPRSQNLLLANLSQPACRKNWVGDTGFGPLPDFLLSRHSVARKNRRQLHSRRLVARRGLGVVVHGGCPFREQSRFGPGVPCPGRGNLLCAITRRWGRSRLLLHICVITVAVTKFGAATPRRAVGVPHYWLSLAIFCSNSLVSVSGLESHTVPSTIGKPPVTSHFGGRRGFFWPSFNRICNSVTQSWRSGCLPPLAAWSA